MVFFAICDGGILCDMWSWCYLQYVLVVFSTNMWWCYLRYVVEMFSTNMWWCYLRYVVLVFFEICGDGVLYDMWW